MRFLIITPERIRTFDLRIRNPLLYPAELQAHFAKLSSATKRQFTTYCAEMQEKLLVILRFQRKSAAILITTLFVKVTPIFKFQKVASFLFAVVINTRLFHKVNKIFYIDHNKIIAQIIQIVTIIGIIK